MLAQHCSLIQDIVDRNNIDSTHELNVRKFTTILNVVDGKCIYDNLGYIISGNSFFDFYFEGIMIEVIE